MDWSQNVGQKKETQKMNKQLVNNHHDIIMFYSILNNNDHFGDFTGGLYGLDLEVETDEREHHTLQILINFI